MYVVVVDIEAKYLLRESASRLLEQFVDGIPHGFTPTPTVLKD